MGSGVTMLLAFRIGHAAIENYYGAAALLGSMLKTTRNNHRGTGTPVAMSVGGSGLTN